MPLWGRHSLIMPDTSSGPLKKLKLKTRRVNSKDNNSRPKTANLINSSYASNPMEAEAFSSKNCIDTTGQSPLKSKKLKIKLHLGARRILTH